MLRKGSFKLWQTTLHSRSVSSLTPLGAAFNSKPQKSSFFPRERWSRSSNARSTGLFQFPELTSPNGFHDLEQSCAIRSQELVEEACSPPSARTRIVARVFDELSDELCRVADMAEFVRLAHPDRSMAGAAERACISVSGLVERLNTNVRLFESLRASVEDGQDDMPDKVDQHVAKLFLMDFYQCGIHLPDADRQKVVELNDSILQLGQHFATNCHRPRVVKKMDLPSKIRHHFSIDGDNIILNGLPVDTPHDMAREAGYKIFYWEDPTQESILSRMVSQRHELAAKCGYPTFGHRAMSESLGAEPDRIMAFLNKLSTELKPRVAKDYEEMSRMKSKATGVDKLQVWDVPYFAMQARTNAMFQFDTSKVSEYFSLGVCMEGLDRLFNRLYGVRLHLSEPLTGELWHNDVYKLSVREADSDEELGTIYCDFFSRSGKPHQDCHFTIRGGRLRDQDQSYQNPVVVLMLNLPPPGWARPTLLSGSMLDNLFHEMGHAMHSMLARTKYQHVTGTRCSTDFAEVPSTLMEYFASDVRVLEDMSQHYQTGEKLPRSILEKYVTSRKVFLGPDIQSQLCYSMLDQKLHSRHPLGCSTTQIMQHIHAEHHSLPFAEGTAWQHRFSHLVSSFPFPGRAFFYRRHENSWQHKKMIFFAFQVGYGARYYSYLLARAVASNIWQQLFQADPFDTDKGNLLRQKCLSYGGGKPSSQIIAGLLGHPVGPTDFVDALLREVDEKQAKNIL